jgi:carboxymethylenebutenolidase
MKQFGKLLFGVGLVMLLVGCSSEKQDYLERMAKEHDGDVPIENAASELSQSTAVAGEEVTYATVNGEQITGYLAKPEGMDQERPGVIVIHEWWGLNNNIRMMTDKLAGEGYAALAVDLYNGRVAETPENAGKYAGSVNSEAAIDNLKQAYDYLAKQQGATNIGTIGWCFGGGWSLQTALAIPQQVDATVIYYGRLITDTEQLKKLEMPILGIFGAEDDGIPPGQVKKLEAALNEVGVNNSIHIYDGASHAFANPSGSRYQKEAAEDAWNKTTTFFERHLK